ncbi:MAG: NTP transferase domain-containing protein [Anaerolineales bacterium]|nr:NTP transferase domain-containing protein [Anaerolineales bacterium]
MSAQVLDRVNAFVAAGKVPAEEDPLYTYTQGEPKAMIDIAGKPMVQWVLDALNQADSIGQIGVLGLGPDDGLRSEKPISYVPDRGGLLQNSLAGLEWGRHTDPSSDYVLFVSADIPAVTGEIIDWRVRAATGPLVDLDYVAVERAVMETRFPDARRSYVRLRDVEICGGDINMIHTRMEVDTDIWDRLIGARKNALRQASVLGFDTLVLLLLRRLTLEQTLEKVAGRLSLKGRVHLSPHAEVAMDLDKPEHLEILRRVLDQRSQALR